MWTALSLGAFADNMLRQALIIGIAFGSIRTAGFAEANDAVPLIGSLFAVAMLYVSSISGQFAEKYETALMFRRTKLVELVLMAIAAAGFALNSGWLLIITLLLMGAQSAFFSPVRMAAMPKYLAPDELVRGNGLCNAGLYVSILLGLFFGGLLIAQQGGGMQVSLVLVAAAAAGWLASLAAPPAAANAPDLRIDWNPFSQSALILRFAFVSPGVTLPLLGAAFFFFASTLVTVLTPLYVRLALGADEMTATAIMGVFAIGAGLGALASAALSKRRSGLGFSAFGISAASVCAIAVYALTGAVTASGEAPQTIAALIADPAGVGLLAAFGASAVCMGLFVVPLQAAAQRRAPSDKRGRIMAASNMLNAAAAIAGSLSVLLVTRGVVGPASAFLLVAALQGAVALLMAWRKMKLDAGLYDTAHFETVRATKEPVRL